MKKLLTLTLALALLMSMACTAMAEDLVIGVNIQEFSNAYLTEMRNGMTDTANELGVTLEMSIKYNSIDKLAAYIEEHS